MKFTQADIDSIITAQENDNLTIFIGAGFSKFSETTTIKFPSWGDLMIALKNDLNTQETDFLKIAQLYYLEFGEYKLYQKIERICTFTCRTIRSSPSSISIIKTQICYHHQLGQPAGKNSFQ